MELQTIGQVSKKFNISSRTLRYYEQIGILDSVKKNDFAYRTYDEVALLRLQQIMILRKLRIPLKQINEILLKEDAALALEVFRRTVNNIEDEGNALTIIKSILNIFIGRINESENDKFDLLGDKEILEIVDTLTVTKTNLKDEKTMENLDKASEKLSKINDVRIIYLPPTMVASIHCLGDQPERESGNLLHRFINDKRLVKIKPDFRHYGFNHSDSQKSDGSDHGYERWVTIPDDLDVQEPFTKKKFDGGLYAAHMIPMGAFEEWHTFYEWVNKNDNYDFNFGVHECMDGLMEEHLNYVNIYNLSNEEIDKIMQLDLLIPIKEKMKMMEGQIC